MIDWLRRLRPGERGLPGDGVLGRAARRPAGLLAKRRATTHHGDLDELGARRAPEAIVVPDRAFVQDGEVE